MNFKRRFTSCVRYLLACLLGLFGPLKSDAASPTNAALAFHGSLIAGTNVPDGLYDIRIVVFDHPTSGRPIGTPVTNRAVSVANGSFYATLNLGTNPIIVSNLWLEVSSRSNGVTSFESQPGRIRLNINPQKTSVSENHIFVAVALLFLLLLIPAIEFLCVGWRKRRDDIVQGFTDTAIRSYFKAFHPQEQGRQTGAARKRFEWYYSVQFGRRRFLLPLIILAAISGLLLCWISFSAVELLNAGTVSPGKLPPLAIVAIMGAYMWVLYDEFGRWHCSDLSPVDLYWWCFRLVIAVPMGYAAQEIFTEKIAIPVVFFLGAFPTAQILTIARRIATQKMGFTDSEKRDVSELQSLQGIDTLKAERFAGEGITTVLQLAYSDPIRLTIRTGLSYSYVIDCTFQALLWIYAAKHLPNYASSGLRSAYEVLDLVLELADPSTRVRSEKIIQGLALAIGCSVEALNNLLEEVAMDPFTVFAYLSWSGSSEEDFNSAQKKILSIDPTDDADYMI